MLQKRQATLMNGLALTSINRFKRPGAVLFVLTLIERVASVSGQVVAYEGIVLPENDSPPWDRYGTFDSQRWVDSGYYYQFVALGTWPGPNGQIDGNKRTCGELTGARGFFVTWREITNCPQS